MEAFQAESIFGQLWSGGDVTFTWPILSAFFHLEKRLMTLKMLSDVMEGCFNRIPSL